MVEKLKINLEPDEYYWEGSLLVLTAKYHLRKGKCCDNGCRHCPYKGQKSEHEEEIKMFESLLKAKNIACIGTSEPNNEEYAACVAIGYSLAEMGKTIISGNAKGCDYAYASGANINRPTSVRLYLPSPNHNPSHLVFGNIIITKHEPECAVLARDNHPKYDNQSDYVKKLFDRNAAIILASDYVIALPNYRNKPWGGGTSHGMKIAKSIGKPVLNISDEQVREKFLDYLRSIVGEK